ncbi:inositol phospholipid synthesis and fat-storage-inducing TM-domain-containing protein [Chytriomyces sp. MP71]|nr:inositol phospholipid synthesis and fat-storage-inducing TM-domain-containing protein [Chytriomyces sp. MP71]
MSLAWKPKPLSSSRIEILAMYSGTVLVFSILSSLFGAPETWMASKGNLLNQLFAKYAWGWTSLLVWTLIALTLSAAPSTSTRPSASGNGPSSSATSTTIPAPSLLARLGVYARACLFWIVTTQWLFGASLTDRVLLSTGACDLDPVHLATLDVSVSASARASPRACKRSGGAWTGFDVSGHCLLLIHCAVLIQEEIERAKTVANAQSRSQVVWVVRVLRALQFLWWFMLIGTAMHFHSLPEAMAGTILTVCFWVVEFTYLSKQAKAVFFGSIAFTTLTIVGVFKLKEYEFTVRRQGIARDDDRRQQMLENAVEYERNEALQRQLAQEQSVRVTSS